MKSGLRSRYTVLSRRLYIHNLHTVKVYQMHQVHVKNKSINTFFLIKNKNGEELVVYLAMYMILK